MKYVFAVLACIGIFLGYSFLGVTIFGWEHGGGILPQLVMYLAMAAAWRAITRKKKDNDNEKSNTN